MQPRTSFRSPLFGLGRQAPAGQKTRFRHRVLHPFTLIALIAFLVLDVFLVLRVVRDEPTRPDPRPAGEIGGSQTGASSNPLGSFGETDIGTPILSDEQVARYDRVGDPVGGEQPSSSATSGSVTTAPTSDSTTSSDESGTGDGSSSTEPSESTAPAPDEGGGGAGGGGSGGGSDTGGDDGSGGGGGGGGG